MSYSWIVITVAGYLALTIVSLFDRYFLAGPIPNPKVYAFSIGAAGFLVCFALIPFGITLAEANALILGLATGISRNFSNLFLAKSIFSGEVSRVSPLIGGFASIFSFFLFLFFFKDYSQVFDLNQVIAFILLLVGSILISVKSFSLKEFNLRSIKYPALAAFLSALTYFLTKKLFIETDFLNGLFLILFGNGLGALFFVFFRDVRSLVFAQKPAKKTFGIFIFGQIFGGLGVFLLYYAVFLASPNQVPLINALEGLRYVFLLGFVALLSFKLPGILKEEISRKNIFQRMVAILIIGAGLAILAL